MISAELDELGRRIEQLAVEPESISAPLTRLLRPILYRIGWRPKTSVVAIEKLIVELGERGQPDDLPHLLERAVEELEDNIKQVEKATVVNRRALISHASWLRRLYEIVVRARRVVDTRSLNEIDESRWLARCDPVARLPPLSLSSAIEAAEREREPGAGDDGAGVRSDPTRVLELQLDTVDEILDAARSEDHLLARRRRLLEAARQMLLDLSAALDVDRGGVDKRLASVARQITRINRMQAAGVRDDVSLLHQARMSLSRRERDVLYSAMSALHESAIETGDDAMSHLTSDAMSALGATDDEQLRQRSVEQSFGEMFGTDIIDAINSGYEAARAFEVEPSDDPDFDDLLQTIMKRYSVPGAERATLRNALSVDGCFDVGGVMSPVRVKEHYLRPSIVPFPTQDLALVKARGPEDLASSLISDPRTVLLDLAAGRLLCRRFVRHEVATRERTVMEGEVRVYLVDGSTSMLGPRARMRDAILIAELSTLMRRLSDPGRRTRVVLYYQYFNDKLGQVQRVDSRSGAVQAIHEVMATLRSGNTDIQSAVLASLERVKLVQDEDPDLARAQIVLITDGEAPLDDAKVEAARQQLGDLPVGVSVIALGEENPALRRIVAGQRRRGQRAFYHFISDDYLKSVSEQSGDTGPPIHLPAVSNEPNAGLDEQLDSLLDDMVALDRTRKKSALRDLDALDRQQRMDRPEDPALAGEGGRGHLEAHFHDTHAINRRFERWFPIPEPTPAEDNTLPEAGTLERDDLESVAVLLATVAEVIELVASSELERRADAIEMLERLLPHSRLSPARYDAIVRMYPAAIETALRAVHAAARSGFWWRMEQTPRGLLAGG